MAEFFTQARVFFGEGENSKACEILRDALVKRLSFIVDSKIKNSPVFSRLASFFEAEGLTVDSVEAFEVTREPSYDDLDSFSEAFRKKKIDALIAVGGGSVLDIAKGVGILLKNPGPAIKYRGKDKVENPGLPVVSYPATAGSGSEATHTASFIDRQSMTKLGINGRNVACFFAVLMPELTFSCPRQVTVASGLDAMLHAVEAVSAVNAHRISALLGSQAFSLLYKNFKTAVLDPENYPVRLEMLLGSYLAGIAMTQAGGSPASAISYPLGVHFGVPHGISGGIFLAHVFEYNVAGGYTGYAQVYDYLADADRSLSAIEKSKDFVKKFRKLYAQIKAPENLSGYGLKKSDIAFLADLTIKERSENLKLNPVAFGSDEVVNLLEKVI